MLGRPRKDAGITTSANQDSQWAAEGKQVARIYAGILGPLALFTTLVHGALHAQPLDAIALGRVAGPS